MKNTKYDLSTSQGLTDAIMEKIANAKTLEEALMIATETEQFFKEMDSKERESVVNNLKNIAKDKLEKLIEKDVEQVAKELIKNSGADLSDEDVKEMIAEITKDKAKEISSELIEEELNSFSNKERKTIMATENEDVILLVPNFLPNMEDIPRILSEIRDNFGKGLESVVVQGKIIVLEYSNDKDIVFGIDKEVLGDKNLRSYARQIFKTLEKYVKVEQAIESLEDKMGSLLEIAKNR